MSVASLSAKLRPHLLLALLLAAVGGLKLYLLFGTDMGSNLLVADEYTNLDYANSLLANLSYASHDGLAYRPPIYSILLAFIKLCFGNQIVNFKVLNIILSLLVIAVIYCSLPPKVNIIASGFLAIHPTYFLLFEMILAENLAILLVAILVYLLTRSEAGRQPLPGISFGLVSGLLALTRPESIAYLFVLYPWLIFRNRKNTRHLAIMLTILHIWLIRNYLIFQKYPILSTNGANTFYLATFPESSGTGIYTTDDLQPYPTFAQDLEKLKTMNELGAYSFYLQKGREYLFQDPIRFLRLLPVRVRILILPEYAVPGRLIRAGRFRISRNLFASYLLVTLFVEGALWLGIIYKIIRKKLDFLYLAFAFGLFLLVCAVIAEARYKIQILPALIIAVAVTKGFNNSRTDVS